MESYTIKMYCTNCEIISDVHIKKGVTIDTITEVKECPNCGCKTLERRVDKKLEDLFDIKKWPTPGDYKPYYPLKTGDRYYIGSDENDCLFDNLPNGFIDGPWFISCPCKRCSPQC